MDIATHALASLALARGVFPGRRWPVVVGIVCAGTLADVDLTTSAFGPAAYFAGRRTFTHSVIGIVVVVAVAAWLARYLSKKEPPSLTSLLVPFAAATMLHIGLDLLQSQGVALLWPFWPTRFAADCLPGIDLWILAVLIAGLFIPELLRLITSEIGVKDRRPRGRNGAVIALALIVIYVGARAMLHADAAASLDPHTYKGESARKVAAFPDAISVFTWHGVVETQSLLCQVDVPVGLGKNFDPEAAECLHKPEFSGELDATQKTDVVRKYLRVEPFPRATVAKTQDGYEVVIRSMRDLAENEMRHGVAAEVVLDVRFGIVDEQFVWVEDVHVR
jgi:membrane-bound metal-dependent hydrolase YbcI (DUF457 family)